ncbi:peptide/nickel transport system permease protein [Bacillus mesophilus]|uniref:ABC transporter permease subunit n=1 Tax=Bacillus mesophilus TaxID=1808955 RepID=A0A6M0Q8X9_9BACI|nr:nickel transporter permease [Bacillus mesophilus]MBM7661816.1 peptide/nickel transport system permease protein [Bacillus mesophilus]NEY72821.1 ABC transporter permease subunit [Bacillus mesophilus]
MEAIIARTSTILRNPNLIIGGFLAIGLSLLTFFGSSLVPHDPFYVDMGNRLQGASFTHWLGTDQLGRDVFSRIIYGAKLTIGLGIFAILVAIIIGVPIGLLSGFYGGRIDAFLMRVVDGILSFPDFILAIAIAGILGPNLTNVIIAIVLVRWIVYARVVRGLVLAEKEKEYVLASKLSHSSAFKTIRVHLIPHVMPDIIVMAAIDIGKIILLISALSYIGIGAQPPIPEWGAMLNEGRSYFQVVPSLMIYPGLAIMVTVLCCNLLGDGLKSYFDTRKGGRRFE